MLAALAVRAGAIVAAPRYAYLMDHVMFMAWSDYAYTHGPTRVYDMPRGSPVWVARAPGRVEAVSLPLACNYPPLATLVFWLQGWLWHHLDDDVVHGYAVRADQQGRAEQVPVVSRVINTRTSRFVNALAGILADLLLALGVVGLVRTLRGDRAPPGLALAAFALTALAPPIVIDAAFWSQSDSWVACLMVWSILQATRGRFAWAGAIYGAALLVKAQALLLGPALLFACAMRGLGPAGTVGRAWTAARATALGALVVILAVALPFSAAGTRGPDGALPSWVERAYLEPVLEQYPYTTTMAFNAWWLEAAVAADVPGTLRDARARVLGVSKDGLGRGALALAVLLAVALAARRFGADPAATVALAAVVCLAAFVLPTRVKARYVYYCLPFLIAMAVHLRPWRVPLAAMLVVATAELTWNLWYDPTAAPARALAVALASCSVGALAWALGALRAGPASAPTRTGDHSM